MTNSSGLGGSFNPTGAADTVKDVQEFIYSVVEGSPTALTATADVPSDAVSIDNCSPCPIVATINIADTAKGSTAPPVPRKVYLKPGQSRVFDWGNDVVVDVTIEEADITSIVDDAFTAADAVTALAAASADLTVIVDFFNQ